MSAYGAFEVVGLRKRGGRSLKLWSREPLDGYAGNERDVLKYRYCSKVHKQQDRKIHHFMVKEAIFRKNKHFSTI